MLLKSGTMLGNRYEIEKRIGSGGMADVYKALDHKLNRNVAVKVLKSEFREDSKFVSKFRIEAQSAAGLMHPNIVNVYDVGDDQDVSYMVMELVEGITLKDYIEKRGRLTAKEVISIAIQVSNGIEAAHRNHIVHRDIKPQNIIISREGKVKVTDFGIARAATSNTISSNAMGSVHYTSPEQARGGYSDAKSDIYSLGITMYEMLTGDVPFDGDSTVTIALKHLQENMVPPSEYAPDIPYSLEQIVMKCCQKSPDRRYANMEELLSDLKQSLVNPNGHFVRIAQNAGDETVFFNAQDMEEIRRYDVPRGKTEEPVYNNYDSDDDDDGEDDEYSGFVDEYKKKDGEGMKTVTKVLLTVAILLIVALAVFFGGKALGIFRFGSDEGTKPVETAPVSDDEEQVEVPSFLGMSLAEAQDVAKERGLGIKQVGQEESEQYEQDKICRQNVEAGTKVAPNTTIEVTVSSGLKGVSLEVPSVVGYSQGDAEKRLEDTGFLVNSEFEESDSVAEGTVISQSPEGGSQAGKGAVITIKVSTGSSTTNVPSLLNMSESDARNALNNASLSVGDVTTEHSQTVPEGQVISQSNPAGEPVEKGTRVSFVVSLGDIPLEEQVWKCNASINIPDYDGSYPLTVTLTQGENEQTLVENEAISNPYELAMEGIPGEAEGTVTMYNAEDGSQIGAATVTFTRVE